MEANFIEIPIERVEARMPGRISVINLTPEYAYPVIPSSFYADNEPYITTSTLAMLFKKCQPNGILVKLSDWEPLSKATRKGELSLTIITPPEFEDIKLNANELAYNQFTELIEIKGTVEKEN